MRADAPVIAALMAVVAAHGRWATIEAIEDCDWFYILGVRMRNSNEARAVADAEGPFTEVLHERETSLVARRPGPPDGG